MAAAFFDAVAAQARTAGLLSDEHFTVDGTQLEAWASLKSFQRRNATPGAPPDDPGNPTVDFHGEQRRNDTHASTTDPEARLYRKGPGREAKLAYLGHVLLDNRHGLVANVGVTAATGTAEREAALWLLEAGVPPGSTVGADKGYDVRRASHAACRAESTPQRDRRPHHAPRLMPSVSANASWWNIFGWMKTVGGKLRHRGGELVDWIVTFAAAAYNLVRIRIGMSIEGRIERGPTTRGRPPRTSIRSEKEAPA